MEQRESTLEGMAKMKTSELADFYKGKRVLITGHTGFKGTWLCRILLHFGADVIGFALPAESGQLFALSDTGSDVRSYHGDVADLAALKDVFEREKPEIVFHLAAQTLVRLSYEKPAETYLTNVMGTVNVLECIRTSDSVASCVNVTTDKVYENKEWIWGYREDERLCGRDPYSNSKSCSELVTYSYMRSFFDKNENLSVSTARSGNVIGGGDYAKDRIIPDCIRAAASGLPIIVRNPHSTRPYQHVLECLYGYLLLGAQQYGNKMLSGHYNFGPDEESCVTTGQLVELFCTLWGDNASWINKSDNGPHEASFLRLDNTKSKRMLDWYPNWTISAAVEQTISFTKRKMSGDRVSAIMEDQIRDFFASK